MKQVVRKRGKRQEEAGAVNWKLLTGFSSITVRIWFL